MKTVKSKTLQEGARKRRLTCQDLSSEWFTIKMPVVNKRQVRVDECEKFVIHFIFF